MQTIIGYIDILNREHDERRLETRYPAARHILPSLFVPLALSRTPNLNNHLDLESRTNNFSPMVDIFKNRLEELVKDPDNHFCADCGARAPRWSSVRLGILICTNCAGIHRKLGTHISFVQSVTIDKWKLEWVELCEKIGNRISNNYYEANVPPHMKRPSPATDGGTGGDTLDGNVAAKLEKWLRNKYELRLFVLPESKDPVELVKAGKNPRAMGGNPDSPASHRSEKKKKKDKKPKRGDQLSPPSPSSNKLILPTTFDWRSNVFIKSWAIANGVADV
jgi:hypothetical protein